MESRYHLHYIIHEDALFDVNNKNEIAFNKKLIESLKQQDKKITLITNADLVTISQSNKLPSYLIEHLEKQGVFFEDILTPSDLFYQRIYGNQGFKIGEVYSKSMLSIEIVRKEIPGEVFNAHMEYHKHMMMLNVMKFLCVDDQFLKRDIVLPLPQELKKNVIDAIDRYILEHQHEFNSTAYQYGEAPYDINFALLASVFEKLNVQPETSNRVTLQEIIAEEELKAKKLESELPKIAEEHELIISRYQTELKKYGYLCYHAELIKRVMARESQKETHTDLTANSSSTSHEKEKETDKKDEDRATSDMNHYPGGKVLLDGREEHVIDDLYTCFVVQNAIPEDDIVIYIGGNARDEHEAIYQAHVRNRFLHSLDTVLPPISHSLSSYNIYIDCVDVTTFQESFMRNNKKAELLRKVSDQHAFVDFESILGLQNEGLKSFGNKNDKAAIYYFRMAYLLADKVQKTPNEIREYKAQIVSKLYEVVTKASAEKELLENMNDRFVENFYVEIIKIGGFELELKNIELSLDLHRMEYPSCYLKQPSNWLISQIPQSISTSVSALFSLSNSGQVDFGFQKIMKDVISLASHGLDEHAIYEKKDYQFLCIEFLDKLKDQMTNPVYQKFVVNTIHAINEIYNIAMENEANKLERKSGSKV